MENRDSQEKLRGEIEKQIAEMAGQFLWRHKAIQVNERQPFRLASGDFVPIYIKRHNRLDKCLQNYAVTTSGAPYMRQFINP